MLPFNVLKILTEIVMRAVAKTYVEQLDQPQFLRLPSRDRACANCRLDSNHGLSIGTGYSYEISPTS